VHLDRSSEWIDPAIIVDRSLHIWIGSRAFGSIRSLDRSIPLPDRVNLQCRNLNVTRSIQRYKNLQPASLTCRTFPDMPTGIQMSTGNSDLPRHVRGASASQLPLRTRDAGSHSNSTVQVLPDSACAKCVQHLAHERLCQNTEKLSLFGCAGHLAPAAQGCFSPACLDCLGGTPGRGSSSLDYLGGPPRLACHSAGG
jgi:hypothetical protein